MSIICALKIQGSVWIGSDGRVTDGNFICPESVYKWRKLGKVWVGLTGNTRSWLLIDGNEYDTAEDAHACLRAKIEADGWCSDDDVSGPKSHGVSSIYVDAVGVWHGHSSGSLTNFGGSFCAEGSGREYAYGAAHVYDSGEEFDSPREIMYKAVTAAIRYDVNCGGNVFVEKLSGY